jgi:spore maturation protein SpmA/spore maturation protein SpmB
MLLNYIWLSFFLIAFVVALFRLFIHSDYGIFGHMIESAFAMAEKAVMDIALPLAGIMVFWMGMMKVAENSGIVNVFARWMYPLFKYIFPEIPKGHPAAGSIMMNFSANFLGLDNSATPLGIKAMKELHELNPLKDVASNSQIMFLVLNTSGLTLIPTSIIALRASNGSLSPADVFLPILLATAVSTLVALFVVSIYQRINLFKAGFMIPLFLVVGVLAILVFALMYFATCGPLEEMAYNFMHPFSESRTHLVESSKLGMLSSFTGALILLAIIALFLGYAALKKINTYESFIEGAKDGFQTVIQIVPYLVAMLVGISFLRSSGAMDYMMDGLKWVIALFTESTQFADALPTAFMRPLSAGGSRALMIESWDTHGIDSLVGHMTSVIQGSTETTFYTIAVYYGAVGIKKVRHTVTCGLLADAAGITAAIILSYIFFG